MIKKGIPPAARILVWGTHNLILGDFFNAAYDEASKIIILFDNSRFLRHHSTT